MDDLDKFVDFLFSGQNGFVYSPVKSPDNWSSDFFAWPAQKVQLLEHIRSNGQKNDVYLCPSVFSKKDAKKDSFKSTKVVWVEFDGKENIDFKDVPRPNAIIQSSSDTHLHCYWNVERISDGSSVEEVNRRLTYYLQADSSGWDCTQLLRPPGTTNHKRDLPVQLSHFEEQLFINALDAFGNAPKVELEQIEFVEGNLLNAEKLLKELPLLKSLKTKIEKEIPLAPKDGQEGQRSQFYYKMAHELAESGCNHAQIVTLLHHIDERVGKFVGRGDRMARLSEMASIAIHSLAVIEDIALYSPSDVLNFTEDLEWIWERYLHSRGFMIVSGAPGVGKTQFLLQLSYVFSTGGSIIGWNVQKKKVLFASLEMDIRELTEVMKVQKNVMPELIGYDEMTRFFDEPGTLLQYEELIEEWQPDVIIIDSLLELMDDDINDAKEVKQLTRWLKKIRRKYNTAVILIHHNRKANSQNKKPTTLSDLFGSVILTKDIETALVLWQEEDQKDIDMLVVKARYSVKENFKIGRTPNLTFVKNEGAAETSAEQSESGDLLSINLKFSK